MKAIIRTLSRNDLILFARFEDGMVIGAAQGLDAMFGDDPMKVTKRSFIDHESAVAWTKQQCRQFLGRDDVDFVEETPEKIVTPARNKIIV